MLLFFYVLSVVFLSASLDTLLVDYTSSPVFFFLTLLSAALAVASPRGVRVAQVLCGEPYVSASVFHGFCCCFLGGQSNQSAPRLVVGSGSATYRRHDLLSLSMAFIHARSLPRGMGVKRRDT